MMASFVRFAAFGTVFGCCARQSFSARTATFEARLGCCARQNFSARTAAFEAKLGSVADCDWSVEDDRSDDCDQSAQSVKDEVSEYTGSAATRATSKSCSCLCFGSNCFGGGSVLLKR